MTDQQPERRDPTQAEIRAACLEIQAEWSEAERQSRACYPGGESDPRPLTIQQLKIAPEASFAGSDD